MTEPHPELKPNHKRARRVGVSVVIGAHVLLLAFGAWRQSPTMDEPAYLVGGISHWRFGRFDLTSVSPPLVRTVAAIPVILSPHEEDWKNYRVGPGVRTEHAVGRDFVICNGARAFWLFTIGRWACIPFSLVGAWACYHWSYDLWGPRSAWAALVLWCFSPDILAHGQMLTPDIGVTALSLAASFAYWKWSTALNWSRALLAGFVLGLALLAKTNAVALFVVLPALALLVSLRATPPATGRIWRAAGQLGASILVALYALNLGYGFEGTFKRLDSYEFASLTFRGSTEKSIGNRFREHAIGLLPVPLPSSFLEGIDLQRRDFENALGNTKTYFCGTWYPQSWWWYYLFAAGIKEPLGLGVLLLISGYSWIGAGGWRARMDSGILFLVIPSMALFALASSQTGFGHSLRYVIPAFPFLYILASGAFRDSRAGRVPAIARGAIEELNDQSAESANIVRPAFKARNGFALVCLVWVTVSSLSVYPHSLAYYNELAGGPLKGHAYLLDGNLDWGQDLLYLGRWMRSHPAARPMHAGYWGPLPINEVMPGIFSSESFSSNGDQSVPPGWYAISVNHLRQDFRMGDPRYAPFLHRPVTSRAGYSIYIYQIP